MPESESVSEVVRLLMQHRATLFAYIFTAVRDFNLAEDVFQEPALENIENGLSPEYVYRETRRAVDGAASRAAVYGGIGLDIPSGSGWGTDVWRTDPDEVYQVVSKAFQAGAAGIVASREYEEITFESLRVVGRAVRDSRVP